jgi:thioredoxin reductase
MMSELQARPLTVIGAGPAGISAAFAAAEAGVKVMVIDENSAPGGQYYRQSPSEFDIADQVAAHSGHSEAAALYAKLDHPNIQTVHNLRVWGVFEDRLLALTDEERTFTLQTEKVVIASGAYDRPLAFPGWTLPGVMGAGAALRMIKTQWLLPGRRVLLAGLGPLQLALADQLLKSGAEVVCVAEAANLLSSVRHVTGFWGHWDRLREAAGYRRTLRRHQVPLRFNHAIVTAGGETEVETATIARLDSIGAPIAGTEHTYAVDTVCLGYGFLPATQLPVAFGCDLRFDSQLRWVLPRHNAQMETTVPGIFVAGDITDMGGAKVAVAEGRVAGLNAAHQLGLLDAAALNSQLSAPLAELRHLNRLAAALQGIYAFRPGLENLMQADTTICRCEEVRCQAVKESIATGAEDLNQVKLRVRAGMGTCQGRFCSPLIAPLIARETGTEISELDPLTVRPPLQPVRLGALAADVD